MPLIIVGVFMISAQLLVRIGHSCLRILCIVASQIFKLKRYIKQKGKCIIRYCGRPCDEVAERVWPIKISDGARTTLFNKGLVSCDVNQSQRHQSDLPRKRPPSWREIFMSNEKTFLNGEQENGFNLVKIAFDLKKKLQQNFSFRYLLGKGPK